ncbi:hydroxyacid dehydrogenase [Sulfobacillus harzensis]|uniref:Hydroxyacid dehydrogenase n=1 Tax=Sulfobacillus harzensis TaxID=2729629 RepID=A0A7Y0L168_9FIRM|nr:hydroxyacid dehydrogenase [Sulfobacillus harzensis]NMP21387.1 hydroxyacid dehydrogenase [Sulfobacillus harzensis]
MRRVLVPQAIDPAGMEVLRHPEVIILGPLSSPDELSAAMREVDAVLIRLWPISGEAIRSARRLKVIAKHGVGTDNIDLEACRKRGVHVTITETANRGTVSEYVLGALITVARHWKAAEEALKAGDYEGRIRYYGTEWAGKTIGVVGYGRIGRSLTPRLVHGLHAQVLVYDPYVPRDILMDHPQVQWADSLDALVKAADAVTLHTPLTPETYRMFDAARLAKMKPGAFLINAARGPIVDPVALVDALTSHHLGGAVLDVFDPEPPLADNPLWEAPNLLVTPHIAASTHEAVQRMGVEAAASIMQHFHLREG